MDPSASPPRGQAPGPPGAALADVAAGVNATASSARPRRRERRGAGLGVGVGAAAAVLVLFLALPLGALVWRAAQTGDLAPETWTTLRQALVLTLTTSLAALVAIVALGTPLAYLLARRRFPGARVVDTLVDLPIVLPPAVAGIALLMAFGRRGVVGGWLAEAGVTIPFTPFAVVLAQVFVAAPFFVRAAKGGFARVDRALEEAAADLGAPPATVFRTVTLPLARPGLAAGATLAWARALGEFGATIMFAGNLPGETQTMALAIYGRYGAGDLQAALILALVLLAASLAILLGVRLLGSRPDDRTG